jgi:dihydrofolate reductase
MAAGAGRIVLLAATSLDGRIADAAGGVDWLEPYHDGAAPALGAFMAGVSCVVMGRATFEQVQGFGPWPYAGKRLVLLSHRPATDLPEPAAIASGPVAALASALRAEAGEAWVVGGSAVFGQFLAAGLVDRIEVFVMPLLLGAGPMLFPAGSQALRLLQARTLPGGVVHLAYAPG